ncbi:hypothetical protein GO594_22260 [Pseudomonas otitidis]|uniref:Uncharacterized protein n=1 Tax=Metapseudomonas otitidis TaxID=319939 RepID=A0A7X3KVG8_9GAMM|nr:hypothetical protein [Pseudomonas otitidis]MWK58715.1 hypothetical protein [Pseudomonas otitidis]
MKIKTLWGFIGNAEKLGADSSRVPADKVFDDVEDEYGHALIGKGLAERIDDSSDAGNAEAAAEEARLKAEQEAREKVEADARAEKEAREKAEAEARAAKEAEETKASKGSKPAAPKETK